jgi:radical SAM protein with 4Fe4S-binding SPASM domain
MNNQKRHTLVLNFDENLISKFNGEEIIITTDSFNLLNRTYDVVNQQNKLLNVTVFFQGAFTSIKFLENWAKIPLAIYVSSLGSYRMFFHMLPLLRKMNLRIFLPASNNQNLIDVQMIASLGMFSGIYFDKKAVDWDKMKELGLYAQFSKSQHAPIEPFHHISTKYNSEEKLDFNTVYYNDPTQFLHINSEGKVALTNPLLKEEKYVLDSFQKINTLKDTEEYNNYTTAWQRHFLEKTTCSYCPAWKICLGKFEDTIDEQKSCQQFFIEIMDGAEIHKEQHKRKPEKVWQL